MIFNKLRIECQLRKKVIGTGRFGGIIEPPAAAIRHGLYYVPLGYEEVPSNALTRIDYVAGLLCFRALGSSGPVITKL